MIKFEKREANFIKGMAMIMMLIHHFLGFPHWIEPENMYHGMLFANEDLIVQMIGKFCKLCVSMFAFTTGYAFYLSRGQGAKKRISRVWSFLRTYWYIFALFLIIGFVINEPLPDFKTLLYHAFGINTATGYKWSYNTSIHPIFAWYVSFFLAFQLTEPILERFSRFGFIIDNFIFLAIPNIFYYVLSTQTYWEVPFAVDAVALRYSVWAPIGMLGYTFCKYKMFEKIDRVLAKIPKMIMTIALLATLPIMVQVRWNTLEFLKNTYNCDYKFDYLYTPILLIALLWFFALIPGKVVENVIGFIQKHSTNIWFLHGIFFTPNMTFQWIAYLPKEPLLIVPWVTILLLGMSMLVNQPPKLACNFTAKIKKN